MHAFQAMIENPREARSYLTDPEIGPILLQVQRAQRVSSGFRPTVEATHNDTSSNSDANDGGSAAAAGSDNEGNEGSGNGGSDSGAQRDEGLHRSL